MNTPGKVALPDLPRRSAPPLHRTFPTWAREPLPEGRVQWRMYRRDGTGAFLVRYTSEPGITREAAAAAIRLYRKTLFSRDESDVDEAAETGKETGKETQPEPLTPAPPEATQSIACPDVAAQASPPAPFTSAAQQSLF